MIARKKMRWEIARLRANTNYLEYEVDTLREDNEALLAERNELREKVKDLTSGSSALLDTVGMLRDSNMKLTRENKSLRLRIMSLEAMWGAIQRRNEDGQPA